MSEPEPEREHGNHDWRKTWKHRHWWACKDCYTCWIRASQKQCNHCGGEMVKVSELMSIRAAWLNHRNLSDTDQSNR